MIRYEKWYPRYPQGKPCFFGSVKDQEGLNRLSEGYRRQAMDLCREKAAYAVLVSVKIRSPFGTKIRFYVQPMTQTEYETMFQDKKKVEADFVFFRDLPEFTPG